MSQSLDRLIYMANQIAREFDNQQPQEAVEATYDHLWHFWDPRMRAMIVDHAKGGGEGLSATALAAVEQLAKAHLKPDSVTRATKFDGPESSRMSDAG
jgi:formate dehydrogenase subunit delta